MSSLGKKNEKKADASSKYECPKGMDIDALDKSIHWTTEKQRLLYIYSHRGPHDPIGNKLFSLISDAICITSSDMRFGSWTSGDGWPNQNVG